MDPTRLCEEALVAHWRQLGELPGGTLHEDDGLTWFETPVRHLPYNGVVRTHLPEADADEAIAHVLERMRARGAELWWCAHPTATPGDLGRRLEAVGLPAVEQMNFMTLDLAGWERPEPRDGVRVGLALDPASVRAYVELTLRYWEVPPDEAEPVRRLHAAIDPSVNPGRRFVAWAGERAVGKAYLSLAGPPGVAAIYGMSVPPEARGRGVAGELTAAMMAFAQAEGCRRAVLHATDMAVGVYARAGFEACGEATAHASAPIWSQRR